MLTPIPLNYFKILELQRRNTINHAHLCLCSATLETLTKSRESFLHPQESEYLNTLQYARRQKTYLLGRYCAKQVLLPYMKGSPATQVLIANGTFGQPVISHLPTQNIQISIAHTDDWGAALAFPEAHPMAIDIETIDPKKLEAIDSQLLVTEKIIIHELPLSTAAQYTMSWTIKEALSKVLKTGMMSPFGLFEISAIQKSPSYFVSRFKNFSQYQAFSSVYDDLIWTLVLPEDITLGFSSINF